MNLQTGIAIASAVLAILGALLVVRRITRPLRSLVDATRRIAAGDYSARLPTREAGEVGRLAREVDAMQHEVEEREAAILHLAFHDDLTDLPNRNQFRIDLSDQTEEARRHQRRLAVAMVDFDRVKSINDMLGHHVGDRLLAAIAQDPTGARRIDDDADRRKAEAGVIGTEQIIESDARATSIERIDALLAREDVASQLHEYGVDPAVIEARVRGLTTAELLALENRLDQQVAGGDALAVIGTVFLVLLILELVGVTDIFKSI